MLTEKQAWEYLAKRWAEASHYNNECYVCVGRINCLGLCPCIHHMLYQDVLSRETRASMILKVNDGWTIHLNGLFRWPITAEGAFARAEFCKTQAEKS